MNIVQGEITIVSYTQDLGGFWMDPKGKGIRITHHPTNIEVSCNSERSQHQNKAICIGELQLKLSAQSVEVDINNMLTVGDIQGKIKECECKINELLEQVINYAEFTDFRIVHDMETTAKVRDPKSKKVISSVITIEASI